MQNGARPQPLPHRHGWSVLIATFFYLSPVAWAADTTPPTITLTSPSARRLITSATLLTVFGTTHDRGGVATVRWTNDHGNTGIATGTTNWVIEGITLQAGTNILTITAQDAAGNTGRTTLTVTYVPPTDAVTATSASSAERIVSNPRQQTNDITVYIDGSVIYGADSTRARALRTFEGGKLKTSEGNLLPLNLDRLPNANDAHIVPDEQLFLAGDVRANENVELTAIHTLFVREHNLIADTIAHHYPWLADELTYQWARQIVTAELQVITYQEFLPALLGPNAMRPYRGYRPYVNPGIANEFSTAGFRVGHTLINDDVEFLDNDGNPVRDEIPLRDAFFNPATIHEVGPDPILKYLATDNAQEVDLKLVNGLRNFLFGPPGAGGFDLASRNIQRGRDHGLSDYNTTRKAYGLTPVTRFDQITSNVELQKQLESLYGDVNHIDLWVGGLAEAHVPGASVGPTVRRIIADQFKRIRDGDSYWYEGAFSRRVLIALESTRLSDIIRRNTIITNLQENVFFFQPTPADSTQAPISPRPQAATPDLSRLLDSPLWALFRVRGYDGRRNNPFHPTWGQTGIHLLRKAPAAYADGLSDPAGADRPSARLISNMVCAQTDEESGEDAPRNDRLMSDWIYGWGQFIDHDLDLTGSGSTPFHIAVPTGDPFFDPTGTGTQVIKLFRSAFDPSTGTAGLPSISAVAAPSMDMSGVHKDADQFLFE